MIVGLRKRTGKGRVVVTMYGRRDTPRSALEQDVEALIRRLTVESQKLAHAFADRHGMHATDFEALVHVMDAEGRGAPLTPGDLSIALGLTSGSTTSVIDRLERHGHVRRDRDDTDRRKVHLRYAEAGMALALEFFGPLRGRGNEVVADFSDDELDSVRRFLTEMSDTIAAHRHVVTQPSPDPTS
jgi:DNA-binding MarR family transcriptional regulator